ncbi:MAG TPA: hypothetical protein VHZ74_07640 [Bryobacteraceae bacterium]|jgi:hypothetical protein|nr:hypothetical protein [Bryobacteraceae bacterium]
MDKRFLRPLLIVEFLLTVQVIFTFWSQVGGQYHLDLMFWPWKLGISVAAAGLIVAITANLVRNEGGITRRSVVYFSVLIATLIVAGVVTYYYHVNEPTEDDDDSINEPARISRIITRENVLLAVLPPAF